MDIKAFSIEDVHNLRLNPTDESKIDLIKKLEHNFKLEKLSSEEKMIAEEILRYLAADISARIRFNVSEKFSDNSSLPYDVALKLAHDLDDVVATPIIEKSHVLKDADLVSVIREGKPDRQKAVAKRAGLSDNVSNALINEAAPEAVSTLINNKKSDISPANAEQLIKLHGTNQSLIKSLVQNKRINMDQAHNLLVRVSEDLQKMLIVEYNIPSTTVNTLIHNSKEWVVLNMIKNHNDKSPNSPEIVKIIEKLQREDELSFSLLIKALSLGNLSFFEAAIAKMADIPVENVHTLLWENADDRGYKGLYQKCKLPESMSSAVYKLIQIVREESTLSEDKEKTPFRIFQKISAAANLEEIQNIDYLVTIVAYNLKKSNVS